MEKYILHLTYKYVTNNKNLTIINKHIDLAFLKSEAPFL